MVLLDEGRGISKDENLEEVTASSKEDNLTGFSSAGEIDELFENYRCFDEFVFNIPAKDKELELKVRRELIREKIDEAVKKMADPEISAARALIASWNGRLEFLKGHAGDATKLLITAVKLNPLLEFAWVALGEASLKLQKYDQARYCFEECLNYTPNSKLALIQLSKIFRNSSFKESAMRGMEKSTPNEWDLMSVQRAKEALKINLDDGECWFSMANAFTRAYLKDLRNKKFLDSASNAYIKSMNCKLHSLRDHPDLYHNMGLIYQLEQNYQQSLENFERSARFQDGSQALKCLNQLTTLLSVSEKAWKSKGALSFKRKATFLEKLRAYTGSNSAQDTTLYSFSSLADGSNVGKATAVVTVQVISSCGDVPMMALVMDSTEEFFIMVSYRLLVDTKKNMPIGKIIKIVDPIKSIAKVDFQDTHVGFPLLSGWTEIVRE